MLRNYLKTAFRTLRRNKSYAALNVIGLAVGLAACLLIGLWVHDELSYDDFHEEADQVYRIASTWDNSSRAATNLPVVQRLHSDYPDLEVAQLLQIDGLMRHENEHFREGQVFFTNPAFFEVFSFPLVRGSAEQALAEPNAVVITEETSQKYFGDKNPIGQTLTLGTGDGLAFEVTGVAENVPERSHFHFDFLLSWPTLDAAFNYSENASEWSNNSLYTYLRLPEGRAPEAMEAQLAGLTERHAPEDFDAALSLQPLTSIHLHSHHDNELETNGRAAYVYLFSIVAGLILLIACINFMNLATARSAERAREVGVRKAAGARRGQLVGQFLTESVLLALVALGLTLVLVRVALPFFNDLAGKSLAFGDFGSLALLAGVAGTGILAGLLAGSYPALFLSGFQPAAVLSGALKTGTRGAVLRRGLVVFQFAASIALIAGTLVVYNQLGYLRSADLGFNEEQVVSLPLGYTSGQYEAFEHALLDHPSVTKAARSSETFPSTLGNGAHIQPVGGTQSESAATRAVLVSHDFFETLGVEMLAGRSFSRERASDSSAFVLNEAAYRRLNSNAPTPVSAPAEMIGKTVESEWLGRGKVVGITENFNVSSLHEAVAPVAFVIEPDWFEHALVRVRPENVSATLGAMEETWQQFFPAVPFSYSFVDQAFAAAYRAEARLSRIFLIFAALAVFIACLGLYGLAAYTAERRTKEIAVRKALGASARSIVRLLSKDFLKLVLFAFVIAAPLAWYWLHQWLEGFAYRVDLGPLVFLAAGALALTIATITTSYQALRAARANPAQALRDE